MVKPNVKQIIWTLLDKSKSNLNLGNFNKIGTGFLRRLQKDCSLSIPNQLIRNKIVQ
jgi:hypothetical protein